jgi:hypothetical protein
VLGSVPLGKLVGGMIALPPGCTVTYAVWVDVDRLTNEMVEWYRQVDGKVYEDRWYDTRGREKTVNYVSYGKGKRCHHHHNGQGGTRLHFHGDDASAASMFILKFFNHVTSNNLQEQMERHARETA